MPAQTYDFLNRSWKSTCKILFGREIGELSDYEEWLSEYVAMPRTEKSALSGKQLSLAPSSYAPHSRFIGFSEIDMGAKFAPLSINDVKDIDSIIESVGERFAYSGSIILGNSKFVEESANVVDSHFVYRSSIVSDSKYVSDSYMIRKCEHMFGVHGDAESAFILKSSDGHKGRRQFECFTNLVSSDCYYCMRCQDSRELFFCFGARSKSYCIGNLGLAKDKYLAIKSKLLSEITAKLERDKRLFSLLDVVREARKHAPAIEIKAPQDEPKGDMGPIERAFTKTSSLLLGRELHGIDNYEDYLKRHVKMRLVCKSPLSGRKAYLAGFMTNLAEIYGIGGSFVTEDEMIQIGRLNAGEKFPDSAKMDVDSLAKSLHPIAYSAMDDGVGISHNMIDCAMLLHSEDCYRTDGCAYSKKCAYNFWPRESEHIFGSWAVWESSFCMKGSQSKRLTRSMEIDTCESCADLYFSHNCENVNDSMFCFNTKNKKYAIGNSEFPRADYLKVKPAILAQLAGELESRRALKWDIFSLAAKP